MSGNQLVDGSGAPVLLRGVNRSSSEYACIDGWGFFHGPVDQDSIDAMKSWGINAVRVPLNSACWLDLPDAFTNYNNGLYAGASYRKSISAYVDLLAANGMYAILDLHWTGCGESSCYANWLKAMPDRPYATQFWSSVAGTFKSHDSVLFDLFNEPHNTTWDCWRDGGCRPYSDPSNDYVTEGMQQMIEAVRAAGADTQPILLGGLQYANDVSGWLDALPHDPSEALVASVHLYNFNWPCPLAKGNAGSAEEAIACFSDPATNPIDPIAAQHPVVFGELGQDDCGTDFVEPMLRWIETRKFGVLGWSWTTEDCAAFPSLITDYDGTPTTLGRAFRDAYLNPGP